MLVVDQNLTANPHRLVEPGPVVLVTTHYRGRNNVMTMGFHGMVQHDPPLLSCVIGPWDYSYRALAETGECVIAIPTVDLAETVVDIGNVSGEEGDKFADFKLSAATGQHVRAPLIEECLANIECRVEDDTLVDKYSLFILKPLLVWIDPGRKERRTLHHNGNGTFSTDGALIDLKHKMTKWTYLTED